MHSCPHAHGSPAAVHSCGVHPGGAGHPGTTQPCGAHPGNAGHLGNAGRPGAGGHPGVSGHPATITLQHPHSSTGAQGRKHTRPGAGAAAQAYEQRTGIKAPRIIAWEITRRCNLCCAHCRASALCGAYPGELSLDECKAVIDDIASITDPILIVTGGEPLMRPDIWDIIDYAHEKGLYPVVGTNGTMITPENARKLHEHGISRISVSIDFPDVEGQDRFRGQAGAFEQTVAGIQAAQAHGVDVQINTTVTKLNKDKLDAIHDLSDSLGAVAFHPFLLVPTGRGEDLIDVELSPDEYEEVMHWAYKRQQSSPMHFKPTDAPMYYRVIRQQATLEGRSVSPATYGMEAMTRGCLGGITFCFISHTGDVQPCGYFDMQLGNVKEQPFSSIWTNSPVFDDLRHYDRLKGKCGACEFKGVCGGCRARALAAYGDYMETEPYCAYQPKQWLRKQLLSRIQADFPLASDPVATLAQELETTRAEVSQALAGLKRDGTIRRVGASCAADKLGYASTLCAMRVPEEDLGKTAALVSRFPNVTHNYARGHAYNLWFTVIARSEDEIERILQRISDESGISPVLNMPATRLYKIRVAFDGDGSSAAGSSSAQHTAASQAHTPGNRGRHGHAKPQPQGRPFNADDPLDVEIIRWAQRDILFGSSTEEESIRAAPFSEGAAAISERTGIALTEDALVRRLDDLVSQQVIRRFGAIVRHQKMGFAFNAMTAWDIPDAQLDDAGAILAASPAISHVYARPRMPEAGWYNNLFGMMHARSRTELDELLGGIRAQLCAAGIAVVPEVLTSTKEFKKSSMLYFEE